MPKLSWDNIGERYFEAGVSRGVIYLPGPDKSYSIGYAWNGLASVVEKAVGDTPTSYYYDGVKYLDVIPNEDFEAVIRAFIYPEEVSGCFGEFPLVGGLIATRQRRERFGLCYRTEVGNDTVGTNYGYRLHLVYNVMASSSDRELASNSDAPDVALFEWTIHTTPVRFPSVEMIQPFIVKDNGDGTVTITSDIHGALTQEDIDLWQVKYPTVARINPELYSLTADINPTRGYKPTAHFVIDSRDVSRGFMRALEDILYGTNETDRDPQLPTPEVLRDLLRMERDFLVFDHADGTFTAAGPDEAFSRSVLGGLVPPYSVEPRPPFRPEERDKYSLAWPDEAHDHLPEEQAWKIRDYKVPEEEEE